MNASSAARQLDAQDAVPERASAPAELIGEVIMVSTSDEFLLEFGQLMGASVIVRPTETIASLTDLVVPTRAQLVAIECTDPQALEAQLRDAPLGHTRLPAVAFVPAEQLRDAGPPLRRAGVKTVLPLPIVAQETRTALLQELEAVRAAIAARIEAGEELMVGAAETASTAAPADAGSPRRPSPLVLGGIAAAAMALAIGGWYALGSGEEPAAAATAPAMASPADEPEAQAAAPIVAGPVDELLDKARIAMRDRRYTDPREDSALLYFRSALAQDPANAEARDGVQRLVALIVTRFEQALTERRFDVASEATADLRSLKGRDAQVTALERRLHALQMSDALESDSTERIAAALRQAAQSGVMPQEQLNRWRAELTRRQDASRLERLLADGAERLRAGQLLEPQGANAKHFALQARAAAPQDPQVQALLRDLGSAFLQRAREAGPRTSEAERWLSEARAVGVAPAQIKALVREAASRPRAAPDGEQLAQALRQRIAEGRLTEPQGDSAVHYLQQLQAAEPDHAAIAPAAAELSRRLLEAARSAARSGRSDAARTSLAAARQAGADAAQIRDIEQLIVQRAALAARGVVPVAHEKLTRTSTSAPVYPQSAARRGQAGQVTLRFVVNARGEPQDIEVASAEPQGVFDHAAITAVRRWRYEPWLVDGVPTPVETRISIRFTPDQ